VITISAANADPKSVVSAGKNAKALAFKAVRDTLFEPIVTKMGG
jgi:hypothetical protein